MSVALILLVLAIVAAIAVVVINRATGPRPDRPREGADDHADIRAREEAAEDGASWEADQPGGPGQESMNPAQPGDPSPGPSQEDRPRP